MKFAHLACAITTAALLGAIAPALADMSGSGAEPKDNTPVSRSFDDKRVDQIALSTDGHYLVNQVVVLTPACVFRAGTDRSTRRYVNKVGFTQDLPLIGGLFEQTPRPSDINDGNRLGLAYLRDQTIFVDIRPSAGPGAPAPDLLAALAQGSATGESQPFAVASDAPALQGFGILNRDFEYLMRLQNFSAVAPLGRRCGADAFADLPPIGALFEKPLGSAHLTQGQLILAVKPSIIAGY